MHCALFLILLFEGYCFTFTFFILLFRLGRSAIPALPFHLALDFHAVGESGYLISCQKGGPKHVIFGHVNGVFFLRLFLSLGSFMLSL